VHQQGDRIGSAFTEYLAAIPDLLERDPHLDALFVMSEDEIALVVETAFVLSDTAEAGRRQLLNKANDNVRLTLEGFLHRAQLSGHGGSVVSRGVDEPQAH